MSLTDPSTLCLLLLAATAVFLLIRTRGQLARQRQQWNREDRHGVDAGNRESVGSSPGSLPDDVARWEVEMHETARQLTAQLDAKLSLLRSLITEADRAAARLEDAIARLQPNLPPGSQAESLRPAAGRSREAETEPESAAAAADLSVDEATAAQGTDRARSREEIYRLADYGFPAAEIARRVGSPVGEVELILSLRKSR